MEILRTMPSSPTARFTSRCTSGWALRTRYSKYPHRLTSTGSKVFACSPAFEARVRRAR